MSEDTMADYSCLVVEDSPMMRQLLVFALARIKQLRVTEAEDGYRVEITGKDVKEKCKDLLESCCTAEDLKKCCDVCCEPKK